MAATDPLPGVFGGEESPGSTDPALIDPHYRPFEQKRSLAEEEWQRRKTEDGAENDAIDELMKLIGLEEVKEQVLAINARVAICELQGIDPSNERFNVVFQGNPGTGKNRP